MNSDLLIIALKKQLENFNSLAKNDNFINLSTEEKKAIVLKSLENNFTNIENNNSIYGKRSCYDSWSITVNRCVRDYCWAGGIAIVATFATGGWGMLGAAAAIIQYHNCLSDALIDFNDCKSSE